MEGNVIVLIMAGCCLFSCCVGLFLRFYFGPDAVNTILSKGLVGDALKDFKFDTSSSLPNIQKRISNIKPQSFKKRKNFGVPDGSNIGEPQDKSDTECAALCFDSEGCFGYTIESGKCQLKGNVTIINYEKGKEIHVSDDVGGTKYGQVPFALANTAVPSLWSNSSWTLAEAADNCWGATECTGFTYLNGVATMYGNVFVLDAGQVGNTYIKFDSMDKSGIIQPRTKYTDPESAGGYHVDDMFFKANNDFSEPPAAAPGLPDWRYHELDMAYFRKWGGGNWNAGLDARFTPPKRVGGSIEKVEECANLCLSNTSTCQSFVYKSSAKECYFRSDLTRDNMVNYVCNEKVAGADPANTRKCNGLDNVQNRLDTDPHTGVTFGCGGRATGTCWSENGSYSETGTDSYYKLQDPMELSCPGTCAPNGLCQASEWTKNDCHIFEFTPTVKETDANFSTQWKFDYFPGQ